MAYVRNTPAINLDDALPQLERDAWLTATLLPYNTNAARAEWRLNWCEDLTSDLPNFRAELCAEMNVSLSEEKTVMLILAVGDWRPVSDGGSAWAMHPPAIREFFIKTPDNSLDIGPLSRLTTALDYTCRATPPSFAPPRPCRCRTIEA